MPTHAINAAIVQAKIQAAQELCPVQINSVTKVDNSHLEFEFRSCACSF